MDQRHSCPQKLHGISYADKTRLNAWSLQRLDIRIFDQATAYPHHFFNKQFRTDSDAYNPVGTCCVPWQLPSRRISACKINRKLKPGQRWSSEDVYLSLCVADGVLLNKQVSKIEVPTWTSTDPLESHSSSWRRNQPIVTPRLKNTGVINVRSRGPCGARPLTFVPSSHELGKAELLIQVLILSARVKSSTKNSSSIQTSIKNLRCLPRVAPARRAKS